MSTVYNPWPEVIARLRTRKQISQEKAAELAGVSTNTWFRWERPGFHPNEKQLEKILMGLGCTADELGAAFAMAMAQHYLQLSEDAEGPVAAAADASAPAVMPGNFYDTLLGPRMHAGPDAEDLETLIRRSIGKSFAISAATAQVLAELITCWPRFRAEAAPEDHRHVLLLRGTLYELFDLCLLMSDRLHDFAKARAAAE